MAVIGACMVPHPPILLPEVGRGEEKKIAATGEGYREAARMIAALRPDTVVISSPHSVMYADYFHISPGKGAEGSMARFRASGVRVKVRYDTELVERICALSDAEGFPAGTLGEKDPSLDHGTLIPLYFLREAGLDLEKTQVVRIGLSGLPLADHYRLGRLVRDAAAELGRRIAWIGSGDLSHKLLAEGPYGFDEAGPKYDARIMEDMSQGAYGRLFDYDEAFLEKCAECGHRSFVMMAGALDGRQVETKEISHEGTFGVGYGICTITPKEEDPERFFLEKRKKEQKEKAKRLREGADAYVRLAYETVDYFVRNGREPVLSGMRICAEGLPAEMTKRRAGAFVSIHKDGRLRGCIGTIAATENCIAEEIVSNAVKACSEDPRFSPVTEGELDTLEISVDILGEPEEIGGLEELDVKRYGVIVTKGYRRGLLLPDLDGVDTVEEQVAIAKRKAGIPEREKNIRLQRFEVVRHGGEE